MKTPKKPAAPKAPKTPKAPKAAPRKPIAQRKPTTFTKAQALDHALCIHPEHMRQNINPLVLLVDCSASMLDTYKGKQAIQHARDALQRFSDAERPVYVFGFSEKVDRLSSIADVHAWGGETLAWEALQMAATLSPHRVIIITDGQIADAPFCRALILEEMIECDGVLCAENENARDTLKSIVGPGEIIQCQPDQLGNVTLQLADR